MKHIFIVICSIFLFTTVNAETLSLITGEWAPYTGEKLTAKGFFSEVVVETIKDMGLKSKFSWGPWKRCEKETELGHYFATFPYTITDDRSKRFNFSDPIYTDKIYLYYYKPLKDYSKFDYQKITDLKKYSVIGLAGYFYLEDFKKAGLENILVGARNEQVALNIMIKGRADILPLSALVFDKAIRQHYPKEVNNFARIENEYSRSNFHIMVSKKYEAGQKLIENFNKSLKKLTENGTKKKILLKHKIPIN